MAKRKDTLDRLTIRHFDLLRKTTPDSNKKRAYWRTVRRHAKYLIAPEEESMHWDYEEGDDSINLRTAFELLARLNRLGHGTYDFDAKENKQDYHSAITLLKIILSGKLNTDGYSVRNFDDSPDPNFSASYPTDYGPFYVILSQEIEDRYPIITESDDIISSNHHDIYLVPRTIDKRFMNAAIKGAPKMGIITIAQARESAGKLMTIDEFIGEYS